MTSPTQDNAHLTGLEVLVVDDEPAIAAALSHALGRAGHRVTTATNLDQALLAPRPAILVADLYLGDHTGLELLETLQRRGDHPRTVFVSGMPTVDDCRRAMRLGAVEMLQKPFSMKDLLHAVDVASAPEGPRFAGATVCTGLDDDRSRELGGDPGRIWRRSYPATSDSVERSARDLSAWALGCSIPPAARTRMASALAEVVDNACRHAYASSTPSPDLIEVDARMTASELWLTVRDRGCGFPIEHKNLTGPVTQHSLGSGTRTSDSGGLARATALSEHLRLDSTPNHGTTVRMAFGLQQALFEDEEIVDLTELDYLTPALAHRVLRAVNNDNAAMFHLSPAIAVSVGRYLAAMPTGTGAGILDPEQTN